MQEHHIPQTLHGKRRPVFQFPLSPRASYSREPYQNMKSVPCVTSSWSIRKWPACARLVLCPPGSTCAAGKKCGMMGHPELVASTFPRKKHAVAVVISSLSPAATFARAPAVAVHQIVPTLYLLQIPTHWHSCTFGRSPKQRNERPVVVMNNLRNLIEMKLHEKLKINLIKQSERQRQGSS